MTALELVERERARLRRLHILAGIALALAISLAVLALGVLLLGHSRWMALPRSAPFVVWLIVGTLDVAVIVWSWRQLRRDMTRGGVAAAIEREQTLRAGALRGALEIGEQGALGRRAAQEMSNRLRTFGPTLAPVTRRHARRRAGQTVAAAALGLVLLGGLAPVFDDGLLAILLPVKAWRGTLLPKIEFRSLPPVVMRGEPLTLDIVAPRRATVTLSQRTTGEGWRTRSLRVRDGAVRTAVGPMRGDLLLVVSDGRSSTDTAVVHVTDRPFVGAVSMRATYPGYLGRPAEGLPVGEPARVPRGTVVDVTGRASTELQSVRLVSGARGIDLQASGHSFTGRFVATETGRWSWMASGASGPISDVPLPLELEVVPDSLPRVELVSPAADTLVAGGDRIPLRLSVSDDHGIARVDVESWKQSVRGRQPVVSQPVNAVQAPVWNGTAVLDLAPRQLEPGDALHVKVVAMDNSPWGQRGESRELILKIPTMEERRAMARDAADSAVREAQAMASAQRSLEQRTGDAARERGQREGNTRSGESAASDAKAGGQQSSMSYEAAEQARAVAKEQRAMAERVKALQEQAAALEQQLKQAGALDSSLARQLRDAQELLRQALTPELLEQMKKLENAAQHLSGDQARQAFKDLAAMQQRLREQLEKSAEMLKRAAFEGAMQTMKDEAKEIAERERKLADSVRSATDREAQQEQARQLAERTQRFSDELKKLQERLAREKADPGAQRTDEARRHADASEEKMREAAGQQQREAGSGKREADSGKQEAGGGKREAGDSARAQGGKPQGAQEQKREGNQRSGAESKGAQGQREPSGAQNSKQGSPSGESMQQSAQEAAQQMEQAAQAMQDARNAQVSEWKKELTGDLDQTIQELLQMAREESAMEQKARSGQSKPEDMRGQQSAVKQGVDEAAQRMQKAGQKSSLLSGRSQRAMTEAQQKVAQATQQMSEQRAGSQAAGSLGEAADALNRAAASLARDRERVNSASSASGFAEMLQQLQEMAKRQGSINAQAQGLLPMPGGQMSAEMQATARALARQQRSVSQQLDELSEGAGGDRAAQLAKEARQLAEALEGGRIDGTTLARQQQLFRRLLDAGRSLEKEEREDSNKREAKAATGNEQFSPTNTDASGRSATKFREPNWNELRGLTPDERRAILDYFKRINERP